MKCIYESSLCIYESMRVMTLRRLAISISRLIYSVYKSTSAPSSPRTLQIHSFRYPSNFRVSSRIATATIARTFNMASGTPSQTPSGTTTTAASSVAQSPSPTLHEEAAGSESGYVPRYVDIGINLTDKMYRGEYHGKKVPTYSFACVILIEVEKLTTFPSPNPSSRDEVGIQA